MLTVTTFGIKNGVAGSGAAGVARSPHWRDGPGGNLAGYPVKQENRNVVRDVAPHERQKPWPNLRLTKAIVLVAPTGFEPALPP